MSLSICSLASGSKGNSAVVFNQDTAILIDAGISYTKLSQRLSSIGVGIERLNAVLITHTHSDHIGGLEMLAKKTKIPIYTHQHGITRLLRIPSLKSRLIEIENGDFFVGGMTITAFGLSHDVRCFGYGVLANGRKITYMTDLGIVNNAIINSSMDSDIILIESNHDVERLLSNREYPEHLKKRILSTRGHLSNEECANTVLKLSNYGMLKQVILAHLSEANNSPELALNCIKAALKQGGIEVGKDIYIDVAEQHKHSKVFKIE